VPEIVRRHDLPLEDIPGLAPEFMSILRRGLAKEPAHRYAEAAALRADLAQLTVGDFSSPRHAVTSAVTTVAQPRPTPPSGYAAMPAGPPGGLLAGPPSGPPPFQQQTVPPRRNRTAIWLGAALAAVLVLAGVWYFALRDTGEQENAGSPPGSSPTTATTRSSTDVYGVATVAEGCPAAAVANGQAQCVRKAECWSGWVMINGEINSVRKIPCDQGHIWEVFAIAVVPGEVSDPYQDLLAENPVVAQVCSLDNLMASRYGEALEYPPERWELEIMPPSSDDLSRELGVYRCVGRVTDVTGITGSVFRPR
jgi:hypothetical protein